MIAIPDIRSAPMAYTSGKGSPLAARLALAMAGEDRIRAPRRAEQTIEIDVLQDQLRRWLARLNADGSFIKPRIHVSLNAAPNLYDSQPDAEDDVYTVWIADQPDELVGTMWALEERWKHLEKVAPGLAPAALRAIEHGGRHSFPLYTPDVADYWASYNWFHGNDDESDMLEEYRAEVGNPQAPAPDDMPTRAWLDKVLPRCVTRPVSRLKKPGLTRLARRSGAVGEIARQVLDLQQACAASHRRKSEFEFSSHDDNGFAAVGYSACLRWNADDPMLRIYDDYVNDLANGDGCEDAYGWFVMDKARELPDLLKELEHYFAIARRIERLIPLIATRVRQ